MMMPLDLVCAFPASQELLCWIILGYMIHNSFHQETECNNICKLIVSRLPPPTRRMFGGRCIMAASNVHVHDVPIWLCSLVQTTELYSDQVQ